MCVMLAVRNPLPDVSLLLLHNRDEFTTRPFQKAQAHASGTETRIYGTDEKAGGTWLAMNQQGVYAAVLNIRTADNKEAAMKSRGALPLEALENTDRIPAFFEDLKKKSSEYAPFNLVIGGPDRPTWFYSSLNQIIQNFNSDFFSLSNQSNLTPWKKSGRMEKLFKTNAARRPHLLDMMGASLSILENKEKSEAAELPETGRPAELERELSSIFIKLDDIPYQTVISTIAAVLRNGRILFFEKNHLTGGANEVVL